MSFINEEEETYEFLNSKTLKFNPSIINENDDFTYKNTNYEVTMNKYHNNKEITDLFKNTFSDIDFNFLLKRSVFSLAGNTDLMIVYIFLDDTFYKCKYKYVINEGWNKINYN